jgi:hypothetical protein
MKKSPSGVRLPEPRLESSLRAKIRTIVCQYDWHDHTS